MKLAPSGKQKKAALQQKRQRKKELKESELAADELEDERARLENMAVANSPGADDAHVSHGLDARWATAADGTQHFARSGKDDKLTSFFARDDDVAVRRRRLDASRPLDTSMRGLPLRAAVPLDLGFPVRPPWDVSMGADALERVETQAFDDWRASVDSRLLGAGASAVSPYECNLEVWRQLWRTLEKSSVVLVAADVRNPLLHLPVALFRHLASVGLGAVVVLTKTDLVSAQHVSQWQGYLERAFFPALHAASSSGKVIVTTFSARTRGTDGQWATSKNGAAARRRLLASKEKGAAQAVHAQASRLLDLCVAQSNRSREGEAGLPSVGIVGQPNTGKSSLLNALVGGKVVSVSRSCGHTKHWQTHLVAAQEGGRPVAQLVDSPGLIFALAWPAGSERGVWAGLGPRQVLEVSGLYPIAQVREVFSAVRLLAERLPLEALYGLALDIDDYGEEWTPYALCGAFADKRCYTVEGGGPDFHRAGLELLRDTVDGHVLLAFLPPDDTSPAALPLTAATDVAELDGAPASPADADVPSSDYGGTSHRSSAAECAAA